MATFYTYNNAIIAKSGNLAAAQTCCCTNCCNEIVVVYDWSGTNNFDLDTKTTFNGVSVGWNCGPYNTQYLSLTSGDNTGQNASETILVRVGQAFRDGVVSGSATINLYANWFPYNTSGPARIRIYCDGNLIACAEISPGATVRSCVSTSVGTLTVNENPCSVSLSPNTQCEESWDCTPTGCVKYSISGYPFSSQSACEAACVGRWECDATSGCVGTFSLDPPSQSGTYPSLSACQAACFAQYMCDPWSGCVMIGYSADSANDTLAECQAVCLERYTCDTFSGCNFYSYGTSGDTLQQCEATCQIQSYVCNNENGCVARYDTSGEYLTLAACEAVCLERSNCDIYSGCVYLGYGVSGDLYSDCATTCTVQSYECHPSAACRARYNDTSGAYASLEDCQAVCLGRYTCNAYNNYYSGWYAQCWFSSYAPTGNTYEQCIADCSIKSYDCNFSDGCVGLLDTSGAYSTQAACNTTCIQNHNCVQHPYYYYYYCIFTGYVVNGVNYSACAANCPPPQMQMVPQAFTAAPTNIDELLKLTNEKSAIKVSQQNTADWQQYFVGWQNPPAPKTATSPEEQDPTGPGTFLAKTLEKIGIKSSPTCSCKARAIRMNEMGNDWCADNVPLIVSWLREEAEKRRLPFIDMAGTLLVKRAISLSRAAKKKQAKNGSTTPSNSDS